MSDRAYKVMWEVNLQEADLLVCHESWLTLREDCVPCIPDTHRTVLYQGNAHEACFVRVTETWWEWLVHPGPAVHAKFVNETHESVFSNAATLTESVVFPVPEPTGFLLAGCIALLIVARVRPRRSK